MERAVNAFEYCHWGRIGVRVLGASVAVGIAWRPGAESGGCSAIVQFAFSRYAGVVVVNYRHNRQGSAAAWLWNRGRDLWALSVPVLIVLKLTGVIAWSWWWVLSPLWISGILLAPVLCVLLAFYGWYMFRRADFIPGLPPRDSEWE